MFLNFEYIKRLLKSLLNLKLYLNAGDIDEDHADTVLFLRLQREDHFGQEHRKLMRFI